MSVLIRGVGSLEFTLKILLFFHNSMLIKLQMYQNCQPNFFFFMGGGGNHVRYPYVFKTHLIKPLPYKNAAYVLRILLGIFCIQFARM